MSNTVRINASILDAIERVQYLVDYIKEIPSQTKTIEYDLGCTSAAEIKNILCNNDIDKCSFNDNTLYVTAPLSEQEIQEKIVDRTEVAEYWAMRLVKWRESKEEFKEQIDYYLDKYADKYKDVIRLINEYKE